MSDLKDDLEGDLELGDSAKYVSFDAFKTLMDAGLSRAEARDRVGLSESVIRDLEDEEASLEIQDEFQEVWDDGDDFDDDFGGEGNDEFEDDDQGGYDDFE
jgi:hypothetical protein